MRLYVWDKWKLMRYCFVIALIGMAFSVAGKVTNDVISTVASTTRKLPIYNIETTEPKISLTFDCAWGAEDMPQILDTLKENNIKATFFVLGEWVDKFPDVIKRMTEEGHDVANHSDTHPHIASLSYDSIKNEIKNANEKIVNATGKENNLFRAPYGEYNDNVISAAEELGFYTIQWDVDSLDWKNFGADNILSRVTSKVKNGSIILMHNGTKDTATVLPELIRQLKDKGYEFKPISEFIYKDNYIIDHAGMQKPN